MAEQVIEGMLLAVLLIITVSMLFFGYVNPMVNQYNDNSVDLKKIEYLFVGDVLEFDTDLNSNNLFIDYNSDYHINRNDILFLVKVEDVLNQSNFLFDDLSFNNSRIAIDLDNLLANINTTKIKVNIDVLYDSRYSFSYELIHFENSSKISFKNSEAFINKNSYNDYFISNSNFAYIKYSDRYKYVDNLISWNGNLKLDKIDKKLINLTFKPNSKIKINDIPYSIPDTGILDFVYDANYPFVKLYFYETESEFIINIEDFQSFVEPRRIPDMLIQCINQGENIPCDLVLEYSGSPVIVDNTVNSKSGPQRMYEGDYTIHASNKNYGVTTDDITVSSSQTISIVFN